MPAESKAQRKLMGMALHHPEKLYKRNRGVMGMSKGQLHDFAKTKEKGLPRKVGRKARMRVGNQNYY